MPIELSRLAGEFVGETNALSQSLARRKAAQQPVFDLTAVTVGEKSQMFPADRLTEIFSHCAVGANRYEPLAFGDLVARQAIADLYAERGLPLAAENICLTPGSSLSYWYLFRLLANPGDEILCPEPGYPLFDYLAKSADVEIRTYPLRFNAQTPHWRFDAEALEHRITTKTRALVVVSPHNPTGQVMRAHDWPQISEIAKRHSLTVIHDEVFGDYDFCATAAPLAPWDLPLCITLGGISKMLSLASLKGSWLAMHGEAKMISRAREALEMLADTFLPVSEPVQKALPQLLQMRAAFVGGQRRYLQAQLESCQEVLGACPSIKLLMPEAGFYLPLQCDGAMKDTDLAVDLLEKTGVLCHPGSFYEMRGCHLVLCFHQDERRFRQALDLLRGYFNARRP